MAELYRKYIGNYIFFFRKIPVEVIKYTTNIIIYFIRSLNWDRGIIFRQGSKPKSLLIPQIFCKNAQNQPKKTPKTSNCPKTDFFGKLILQKSTSYGTSGRSAKGKMTAHWSSFFQVFIKNSTSTWFLPSKFHFFMKTHFFI